MFGKQGEYEIPNSPGSSVFLNCRVGHLLTGISLIPLSGQGPSPLDKVIEDWCVLALTETEGTPLSAPLMGHLDFPVPVDYSGIKRCRFLSSLPSQEDSFCLRTLLLCMFHG